MVDVSQPGTLQIRKYPNRRYYDVTRSRHVTLQDILALVRSGHEVRITDSRTGNDLTNHVLLQIILEHDQAKLDLVPSSILHMLIRSPPAAWRSLPERVLEAFAESASPAGDWLENEVRRLAAEGIAGPPGWGAEKCAHVSPRRTGGGGAVGGRPAASETKRCDGAAQA
jgi:polyhydroxyalkanoate synthesis repressor PhaR